MSGRIAQPGSLPFFRLPCTLSPAPTRRIARYMKELEAEIWCPQCKALYGRVFREEAYHGWNHVCEPSPIPKYCGICEKPTERKHAN